MDMTVSELLEMFTDNYSLCEIYDLSKGDTVFHGTMGDAMYSDYSDCLVMSLDPIERTCLTINIETEE